MARARHGITIEESLRRARAMFPEQFPQPRTTPFPTPPPRGANRDNLVFTEGDKVRIKVGKHRGAEGDVVSIDRRPERLIDYRVKVPHLIAAISFKAFELERAA